MKSRHIITAAFAAVALSLASCASKKAVTSAVPATTGGQPALADGQPALTTGAYVRKVCDNSVYADNIVGNATLRIKGEGKDLSVPGALRMRRDKVIRLQVFLPLLGTEVARVEFTPSYVLLVDRMHKEYVKADYTQVDFLKNNGLSFYSLQALFWNQLFVPGEQKLGESAMKKFSVDPSLSPDAASIALDNGNISCQWTTDKATGRIDAASVGYKSSSHGTSTLDWLYSGFTAVGVKQFPASQTFTFTTTATQKRRSVSLTVKMSGVKTSSDWDAATEVSPKYKRIDTADILNKLLQF